MINPIKQCRACGNMPARRAADYLDLCRIDSQLPGVGEDLAELSLIRCIIRMIGIDDFSGR
jgi:hypothetical protein